jgi:hypothetical protein
VTTQEYPEFDQLADLVGRWKHVYAGALLQVAVAQSRGEWRVCAGKLTFSDKLREPAEYAYPEFRYVAEWLSVDDAVGRLEGMIRQPNELQIADLKLTSEGRFDIFPGRPAAAIEDGIVSHARRWLPSLKGWPYHIYSYYLPESAHVPYGDLSSPGQPYYPHGADLIRDLMGLEERTSFSKSVTVCIPQFKAMISGLVVTSSGVKTELIIGAQGGDGLVLQYYGKREGDGPGLSGEIDLEGSSLDVDLGGAPSMFHAVLFDRPSGDFLDVARMDVATASESQVESFTPEFVRILARTGENQTLEYKPRITDARGRREVAESAIAFANARGGIILIGLDDQGRIKGAQSDHDEMSIVQLLRARCDPPIDATIRKVDLEEDLTVYVVQIEESASKPHLMRSEGIAYVRRNSGDMPITRAELDEIYRRKEDEGIGRTSVGLY